MKRFVARDGTGKGGGAMAIRALAAALLALAASLSAPLLHLESRAEAQAKCAVWSTYGEQDGKATNLTATACASTEDDASALGFQCTKKKPQVRYYPESEAQEQLPNNTVLAATFAVGDDSIAKNMRYDHASGAFGVAVKKNDPLLQLLQSGGPLDVTSAPLGTHRFRLLGSTAAIAAVMGKCGVTNYIGPPPPATPDDTSL